MGGHNAFRVRQVARDVDYGPRCGGDRDAEDLGDMRRREFRGVEPHAAALSREAARRSRERHQIWLAIIEQHETVDLRRGFMAGHRDSRTWYGEDRGEGVKGLMLTRVLLRPSDKDSRR